MAKIFYFALADEMLKTDKLNWFRETPLSKIDFERIKPDAKGNWINQTDNDFESLLPLMSKEEKGNDNSKTIFKTFSRGFVTQRDEWVFDFKKNNLKDKIKFLIETYQKTFKNEYYEDKMRIKWDRELESYLKRRIEKEFDEKKLIQSAFRPFIKKYWYFDKHLNGMMYQWGNIYNPKDTNNFYITFRSFGSNRDFNTLVSNIPTELHLTGANQCLPLSIYNKNGEKKDNITDWALKAFQNHYNNKDITKDNIFYYVYAVLHTPQYRTKYEQNLKREFPRIPYYKDFMFYVERGKQLADLHINYEKIEPYPLERENILKNKQKTPEPLLFEKPITDMYDKTEQLPYIPKAKLKARKETGEIEIDDITILRGIPAEAWTYKLGNRSALEWILDQYKESKPSDKTIAEHFNTYRFADYKEEVIVLLKRVCRVSIETVRIVGEL